MMKYFAKETILDLLVICAALIVAVVSWRTLNNSSTIYRLAGIQVNRTQIIGEINQIQMDVRRRSQKSILWQPMTHTEIVFEGDSIFTGKDSEAQISLSSGDSLRISANSVILVETKNGDINLDLQVGSVIAKLAKNQTLHIRQDNQVVRLKSNGPSSISIVRGKKKIRLHSLEGKVEVSSKGQTVKINTKKVVEISKNMPMKTSIPNVSLIVPKHKTALWLEKNVPTPFSWNGGKPDMKVSIQISRRSDFINTYKTDLLKLGDKNFQKSLKPGTYWWQIVDSSENIISTSAKFSVVSTDPIRLLYPHDGDSLFTDQKPKEENGYSLEFIWKKKKLAKKYELEISGSDDFISPLQSWSGTSAQVVRHLQAGTYFWRVRASDGSVKFTHWSKTSKVTLGESFILPPTPPEPIIAVEPPPVEVPQVTKPVIKKRVIASKPKYIPMATPEIEPLKDISIKVKKPKDITNKPISVKLDWIKEKRAKGYRVEGSETDDFSNPFYQKFTKESSVKVPIKKNGTYHFRVAAMKTKKKLGGEFSEPKSFELTKSFKLAVPKMITNPTKEITVVQLGEASAEQSPVIFSWEPVKYASTYQVQFSTSKDFSKTLFVESISDTSLLLTKKLPEGTIFWRIRSESSENPEFTSKWSTTNNF